MLAGAGLGDHAGLAHPAGEHGLADTIVDLVRAGVVEVFALQVDLGATEQLRPALGVVDGAGATDVVLQFILELGDEGRVLLGLFVSLTQFGEGRDQRFCDENAAIGAEVTACIG